MTYAADRVQQLTSEAGQLNAATLKAFAAYREAVDRRHAAAAAVRQLLDSPVITEFVEVDGQRQHRKRRGAPGEMERLNKALADAQAAEESAKAAYEIAQQRWESRQRLANRCAAWLKENCP